MLQTFQSNLKDATDKENDAIAAYNKLKTAKQGQLDAAKGALTKMESEGGAKGLSKQEAQDELNALTQQVSDDKKFISQTETALKNTKTSYQARKKLRAGELEAISKAIAILTDD